MRQSDKRNFAGEARDAPQADRETPIIHDVFNGILKRFGWSVGRSGFSRVEDNFVSIPLDGRTMSNADVVRNPLRMQIIPGTRPGSR